MILVVNLASRRTTLYWDWAATAPEETSTQLGSADCPKQAEEDLNFGLIKHPALIVGHLKVGGRQWKVIEIALVGLSRVLGLQWSVCEVEQLLEKGSMLWEMLLQEVLQAALQVKVGKVQEDLPWHCFLTEKNGVGELQLFKVWADKTPT